jgi:SAM-dependent methyltransferase
MELDSTQRFSSRVEAYVRYRPSYPPSLTDYLAREFGLKPESTIADVGCGTGLLAKLLLEAGCEVYGVEPNDGMRQAAGRMLGGNPRFHLMAGRAENLPLGHATVEFITAGQAFHWFQPEQTRGEFARVLKPGGRLVLVWNERRTGPGFQAAYDAVVRQYAPETERIREGSIDTVFGHHDWRLVLFDNEQRLDREGLRGRLESSSYAPLPGAPGHQVMVEALDRLFDEYQEEGRVTLLYDTRVYCGAISQSVGSSGM